jgi:signal transduction histidine kinase
VDDFSDEIQGALFRTARELLTNTLKHAGVNRASVALDVAGDDVILTVEDAGRGFVLDAGASTAGLGFGLLSIRDRLSSLGGELEIETEPGIGTRATAVVPRTAPARDMRSRRATGSA